LPTRRTNDIAHNPLVDGDVCPRCGQSGGGRAQIQKLQERIAALEAENATLIASATAFGDLADRLNKRLREVTQAA
jgi:hypothetical protein